MFKNLKIGDVVRIPFTTHGYLIDSIFQPVSTCPPLLGKILDIKNNSFSWAESHCNDSDWDILVGIFLQKLPSKYHHTGWKDYISFNKKINKYYLLSKQFTFWFTRSDLVHIDNTHQENYVI